MSRRVLLHCCSALVLSAWIGHVGATAVADPDAGLQLHYGVAATTFNEALPLGNGRMGVMVYGGVQQARFSLSETSLWSGSRHDAADRTDAVQYFAEDSPVAAGGRERRSRAADQPALHLEPSRAW